MTIIAVIIQLYAQHHQRWLLAPAPVIKQLISTRVNIMAGIAIKIKATTTASLKPKGARSLPKRRNRDANKIVKRMVIPANLDWGTPIIALMNPDMSLH